MKVMRLPKSPWRDWLHILIVRTQNINIKQLSHVIYMVFDKFDPRWSHGSICPESLHQAKESGACSVDIWGLEMPVIEFMFAGDLADAIYKALEDIESMPELLNIGIGHDYSINDYYEIAAKIVGYTGTFIMILKSLRA